eukprot:Gb_19818 [translate_table: standard]
MAEVLVLLSPIVTNYLISGFSNEAGLCSDTTVFKSGIVGLANGFQLPTLKSITECRLWKLFSLEQSSLAYEFVEALRNHLHLWQTVAINFSCAVRAKISQESVLASLKEWLGDSVLGNNSVLRLVAGTIYMHEQDYNEALKHTHSGGTLELCV